jgi:hypothetical protein
MARLTRLPPVGHAQIPQVAHEGDSWTAFLWYRLTSVASVWVNETVMRRSDSNRVVRRLDLNNIGLSLTHY